MLWAYGNIQPRRETRPACYKQRIPFAIRRGALEEMGRWLWFMGSGSCTISANGPWGCCLCRSVRPVSFEVDLRGLHLSFPLRPMVRGTSWGWPAKPTLKPLFSIKCRPRFGSVRRNWAATCQSGRRYSHKARQHLLVGLTSTINGRTQRRTQEWYSLGSPQRPERV